MTTSTTCEPGAVLPSHRDVCSMSHVIALVLMYTSVSPLFEIQMEETMGCTAPSVPSVPVSDVVAGFVTTTPLDVVVPPPDVVPPLDVVPSLPLLEFPLVPEGAGVELL